MIVVICHDDDDCTAHELWCLIAQQKNACHKPPIITHQHPTQEHLFLVTELLRANLYEFQKYNHKQGGAPYFTLPRMQKIATQVRVFVCMYTCVCI